MPGEAAVGPPGHPDTHHALCDSKALQSKEVMKKLLKSEFYQIALEKISDFIIEKAFYLT